MTNAGLLTLLLLSVCCYTLLGLLLSRNIQAMPAACDAWAPTVSVIIAARNEEASLRSCLGSLAQLDYPEDKLEIIVVNDASTDKSAQIIDSFQNVCSNMQHIQLAPDEKEKAGKAGALLIGIEKSVGEIIFFTDADCQVSRDWIRDMLNGFGQDVGVVGGFTLLTRGDTVLARMQALDWHFLLSIASAASHLNKPISWVGNNLAVRRSAYVEMGGYRRLGDSFVEDFALINAIEKQTRWQCRFYASPKSIVRTFPARTIAELYAQRKRWSTGIAGARPFGWWVMTTAFVSHLSLVISLALSPTLAIIMLLVKSSVDILILRRSSKLLDESLRSSHVIAFEIYYILSSLLLPIAMIFDHRVAWKGAECKHA
ncbi:glycosyltransferase [candidate division KSB1 bacterium]|nr:glycosyltransferase [candidate division KSB1 bacterium]